MVSHLLATAATVTKKTPDVLPHPKSGTILFFKNRDAKLAIYLNEKHDRYLYEINKTSTLSEKELEDLIEDFYHPISYKKYCEIQNALYNSLCSQINLTDKDLIINLPLFKNERRLNL